MTSPRDRFTNLYYVNELLEMEYHSMFDAPTEIVSNTRNNNKKILERNYSTAVSGYSIHEAAYGYVAAFISNFELNGRSSLNINETIHINKSQSFYDVVMLLVEKFKLAYNFHENTFVIMRGTGDDKDELLLMVSDPNERSFDIFKAKDRDVSIVITGDPNKVLNIKRYLEQSFEKDVSAKITWKYLTDQGVLSRQIYLTNVHDVYPEFYPYLRNPYNDYVKNYLTSEEPILILLGPPGTGKTSFIRRMLFEHKLRATVFYDEKMMQTDRTFVDFLTRDEESDILILEDADTLLLDRKESGNTVMSKLLNASDGLVNVVDKKIIITANLTDVKQIDHALMRPGRCHDTVMFRSLTPTEAEAAAKAANITSFKLDGRKNKYTLAELFSGRKQEIRETGKVGFF